MNRNLAGLAAAALAASALFLATPRAGALPGMTVSAGLLVGEGLKPGDVPASAPNPYGLGLGVRAGLSIIGLYAGATFVYHLGGSDESSGVSLKYNVYNYGLEGGYDIGIGPITLRPYLGFGQQALKASLSGRTGGVSIDSSDSTSRFYLDPGVVGLFNIGTYFVGVDANYIVVFKKSDDKSSLSTLRLFATAGLTF